VQKAQADPIEINKSREAPGRRLTFGLKDLELGNHLSPIQISEREFLSLSHNNPQELFDKLFNQQNGIIQQSQKKQQNLEDKIGNLKQRIRDQTATIRELINKRNTAQDMVSRMESGTPAPEVKYPKSTKLPDGQVLVDKKDPKFES
jgi:vacuolar-type H+-ATPase subunit I/STV1